MIEIRIGKTVLAYFSYSDGVYIVQGERLAFVHP